MTYTNILNFFSSNHYLPVILGILASFIQFFYKRLPLAMCALRRGLDTAICSKIPYKYLITLFYEKIGIKIIRMYSWIFIFIYNCFETLFVILLTNAVGILSILFKIIFFNKENKLNEYLFNSWDKTMVYLNRKKPIKTSLGDDYLIRYYILFKDRAEWLPINIFIHNFKASDPDDLHNHPWDFATFILKGGYYEHIEEKSKCNENKDEKQSVIVKKYMREPGYFNYVTANHKHRVELNNQDCWTLFIPFKRKQKWGFYVNDNFIENTKYYDLKNKK